MAIELKPPEQIVGHDGLQPGTILVVDDEADIVNLIRDTLEMAGYAVCGTTSAQHGLEVYRDNWPKIVMVLADLAMPAIRGDRLYEYFRAINPKVHFILVTGYVAAEVESLIQERQIGVLPKPFHLEELVQKIRATIASPMPLATRRPHVS
ncbi:MAG: hypothetical protein PCFJNLEI_03381 [Verrucomicrobiae bacterium]|nr:hypothetical protein [Verrucomicrobiae bacterium]